MKVKDLINKISIWTPVNTLTFAVGGKICERTGSGTWLNYDDKFWNERTVVDFAVFPNISCDCEYDGTVNIEIEVKEKRR